MRKRKGKLCESKSRRKGGKKLDPRWAERNDNKETEQGPKKAHKEDLIEERVESRGFLFPF